jgi:hypothetical protein
MSQIWLPIKWSKPLGSQVRCTKDISDLPGIPGLYSRYYERQPLAPTNLHLGPVNTNPIRPNPQG